MDHYLIHAADLSIRFQWDRVSYLLCKSSEKTELKMGNDLKETMGNNPHIVNTESSDWG